MSICCPNPSTRVHLYADPKQEKHHRSISRREHTVSSFYILRCRRWFCFIIRFVTYLPHLNVCRCVCVCLCKLCGWASVYMLCGWNVRARRASNMVAFAHHQSHTENHLQRPQQLSGYKRQHLLRSKHHNQSNCCPARQTGIFICIHTAPYIQNQKSFNLDSAITSLGFHLFCLSQCVCAALLPEK